MDDRGRLIDEALAREIAETVFAESHGAFADHLGAGLIYYALATALHAQVSVCIGSGGGFVPRLLYQAQRDLRLADAHTYLVDANLPDLAFGSPIDPGGWLTSGSKLAGLESGFTILRMLSADAAPLFARHGVTIDYLHIDGDHSTRGVLADLTDYVPLMSATSVATFHDLRLGSVTAALAQFMAARPEMELLSFPELGNGSGILRKKAPALPPVLGADRANPSRLPRRTALPADDIAADVGRSQHKTRFERWHYLATDAYKLRYELIRGFVDVPGATIVEIGGFPNSVLSVLDKARRLIAIEPYIPPDFAAEIGALAESKKIGLMLSPGTPDELKIDLAAMAPYRLVMLGFDITSACETRDDFAQTLSSLVTLMEKAELVVLEFSGFLPSEIAAQALIAATNPTILHDVTLDLAKDPVAEQYFVTDQRAQRRVLVLAPGVTVAAAALTIVIGDAARRLAEFGTSWDKPGEPDYVFGEPIEFVTGTGAARFLAGGWSGLEPEFTWAIGDRSKLHLRVTEIPDGADAAVLQMSFHPFIAAGKIAGQRLTIKVNDIAVFDGSLSTPDTVAVSLPRGLLTTGPALDIELSHPDGARPIDVIPGAQDGRVLSVAIRSLRLVAPAAGDKVLPSPG